MVFPLLDSSSEENDQSNSEKSSVLAEGDSDSEMEVGDNAVVERDMSSTIDSNTELEPRKAANGYLGAMTSRTTTSGDKYTQLAHKRPDIALKTYRKSMKWRKRKWNKERHASIHELCEALEEKGAKIPFFLNHEESDSDDNSNPRKLREVANEDDFEEEIGVGFDWHAMAQGKLGQGCLFQDMPASEVSRLVGWATNLHDTRNLKIRNSDSSKRWNVDDLQHKHCNRKNTDEADKDDFIVGVAESDSDEFSTEASQSTAPTTETGAVAIDVNCCFHVPTAPPAPSELVFLATCATEKVRQSDADVMVRKTERYNADRVSLRKKRFRTYSDDENDEPCDDEGKGKNKSQIKFTTKLSTLYKSFRRTEYVDAWIPYCRTREEVPLPTISREEAEARRRVKSVCHTFDETALVGLGMAVKESLTAMMIPLAREHVARCRLLERKNQQQRNKTELWSDESEKLRVNKDIGEQLSPTSHSTTDQKQEIDDPFHEWTLPPEEAILKLISEQHEPVLGSALSRYGHAYLPSSTPPTRTLLKNDKFYCKNDDVVAKNQEAVVRWCTAHNLDYRYVRANMDLFSVFLHIVSPPFLPPLLATHTRNYDGRELCSAMRVPRIRRKKKKRKEK